MTPLTDSNDMPGGSNTGSDFVLCEVNQPIPDNWSLSMRAGMRADTMARLESASTTPTVTEENLDVYVSSDE